MKQKISITRALTELKVLDSRISKQIESSNFVGYSIGKNPVVGYSSNGDFMNESKRKYQSIKDLIDRRSKIKAAIVASNSLTKVQIVGVTMTIADVIEKKNSIGYEKNLLQEMKKQFLTVKNKVEEINRSMESASDEIAQKLAGKDTKVNTESLNHIKKFMQDVKEPVIVDGINIKKEIEALENFIIEFEKEVDFTLSESNTRTEIEVEV